MQNRREQRDEQRRVGRIEDEIAAEQTHIGPTAAPAMTHIAGRGSADFRIE